MCHGDVCETLGYYEANDGGGARYVIRLKVEEDIEDKGIIHFFQNNLVAELIIKNEINFKSLGAKDSKSGVKYDCKSHLLTYLNYVEQNGVIKLVIPAGFYCFSATDITGNGCVIEGVSCKDINALRGTLFMPMTNKQDYIICIGKQDATTQNVVMSGITFTSVNPSNNQSKIQSLNTYDNTNVITQTLKMINLYACDFKDINFACIRGKAVDISSICECNIENMQLRYIYNPAKFLINFANHTDIISNCSALFIDNINVESYVGNIFNFEKDSNVINSSFGTIIVEDRAMFKNFYKSIGSWFKEDGITKNCLGDDDYNNATNSQKNHYAIFRFEGKLANAEFAIDKILLNNFSSLYYKANSGSIHGNKIIFNFVGKYSYINIIVNAIQHMTASVDTIFINCLANCISSLTTRIKIGNINRFSQNLNYVINTDGMYGIKNIDLGITGFNQLNNSYQRFVDYVVDYQNTYTYPQGSDTNLGYYGGEYYDNEALSKNHIAYRYPNPHYYANVSDKAWVKIPVQGSILRLRGKLDSNLTFILLNSNTEIARKTLSDTDNTTYKWYEIDLSETTNRDDCVIYIKQETGVDNKVNILDCFYWK